ncbi:hypothetical protein EDC04DRAFT_658985 [Pisolithus marmoratus]|nr:hypothetical protein EDC04DRAFT_658985 [Pisolithus marmoratus]
MSLQTVPFLSCYILQTLTRASHHMIVAPNVVLLIMACLVTLFRYSCMQTGWQLPCQFTIYQRRWNAPKWQTRTSSTRKTASRAIHSRMTQFQGSLFSMRVRPQPGTARYLGLMRTS